MESVDAHISSKRGQKEPSDNFSVHPSLSPGVFNQK
jgi:hypothetical protein